MCISVLLYMFAVPSFFTTHFTNIHRTIKEVPNLKKNTPTGLLGEVLSSLDWFLCLFITNKLKVRKYSFALRMIQLYLRGVVLVDVVARSWVE